MADFLLIHGAWHGAWCWAATQRALEAAGHRTRAIDLPTQGEDRTPVEGIGLQHWIDRTVDELRALGRPQILVGHSMGGMVITGAADAAPELVSRAVYVCAFLPEDGESLMALASRPECVNDTALVQVPTPDGLCVTVTPESARAGFYGHCAEADIADALPRLRPLPVKTVFDAVSLRHATPPVPRSFVACTEDRAMPIALQRFLIERSPGMDVKVLESDHSPFVSHTDELAAVLQNQL